MSSKLIEIVLNLLVVYVGCISVARDHGWGAVAEVPLVLDVAAGIDLGLEDGQLTWEDGGGCLDEEGTDPSLEDHLDRVGRRVAHVVTSNHRHIVAET